MSYRGQTSLGEKEESGEFEDANPQQLILLRLMEEG